MSTEVKREIRPMSIVSQERDTENSLRREREGDREMEMGAQREGDGAQCLRREREMGAQCLRREGDGGTGRER